MRVQERQEIISNPKVSSTQIQQALIQASTFRNDVMQWLASTKDHLTDTQEAVMKVITSIDKCHFSYSGLPPTSTRINEIVVSKRAQLNAFSDFLNTWRSASSGRQILIHAYHECPRLYLPLMRKLRSRLLGNQ